MLQEGAEAGFEFATAQWSHAEGSTIEVFEDPSSPQGDLEEGGSQRSA